MRAPPQNVARPFRECLAEASSSPFFFQKFPMNPQVQKALQRADETRDLLIGEGVLPQVAAMFQRQFPGKKAIVVADTNTWRVAGQFVEKALSEAGIEQEKPYIFDAAGVTDEGFHAEWTYVMMLEENLKTHDAIPVACGSGTINDLCKVTSYHLGRRYMVCGTAASMDGYTAFGAAITKDGKKSTHTCPAPQAALVDTLIAAEAPQEMTASGYADLYAKIPAGADWILSDALGVEPIDEHAWSVVQDGLAAALGDPEGLAAKKPEAFGPLLEGLILGGFAMQAHKSSRPASGADHQFSHLWEMEHHTFNGVAPSHGFKVAIGTLASLALYDCFLRTDMTQLDVEACVNAWPSLEDQQKVAAKLYEGTDFPDLGVTEITAKYSTPDELRKQLTTLKENWPEIRARLEKQVVPVKKVQAQFAVIGAPKHPEEIGITRERFRSSFLRAQHARRRFTILDIAVRTGNLEKWIDEVFAKNEI